MVRAAAKLQAVVLVGVLAGGLLMVAGPASAGGGSCHDPKPVSGSGVAVDAKDSCFFPTILYVKEGATVTWTNRDAVPHSVTGLAAEWGSGQKTLQQGDSVSVEFSDPGVFPYSCILHPGMVGAVVVGEPSAADAGVASVPIGRAASESGAQEEAPANSAVAAKSEARWPWALVGMVVLAALLFLGFDMLRGRRLRSVA
jgi:plastocyanin